MAALMITLPQYIKWEDYIQELKAVEDRSGILNYKLPGMPSYPFLKGSKCYLVWRGYIRGWQEVSGVKHGKFRCQTTGKQWPDGYYLQRTGPFNYLKKPYKMKGFQGLRYIYEELQEDIGSETTTDFEEVRQI